MRDEAPPDLTPEDLARRHALCPACRVGSGDQKRLHVSDPHACAIRYQRFAADGGRLENSEGREPEHDATGSARTGRRV